MELAEPAHAQLQPAKHLDRDEPEREPEHRRPQQLEAARSRCGPDVVGVLGHGVPEYEVALATAEAGTRKSAELLAAHYDDPRMSPNTHFLQIMASGAVLPEAKGAPKLPRSKR